MVAGIPLVVCDGRRAEAIVDAAAGEDVGHCSWLRRSRTRSRPRSCGSRSAMPRAALAVDDGAKAALIERGSSLVGGRALGGRALRGERHRRHQGCDGASVRARQGGVR
ncbi:MAG: hypothetical protein ACLSVD_09615 [Eggerthellaceae bacterium]